MSTYSHSQLSTFEQCRYKYKLSYIDNKKVKISTVEAFMGNLVHASLEKLYKDLKFKKLNSLKELIAFYNNEWEKGWTDDIIIAKKEYAKENYRKMGEQYIIDYYSQYQPFDQMTIIGLETKDKIKLKDGSYYCIRIDKFGCKDNIYYVCDYKTNSKLKNQLEADTDRQLAMYSIWVKNKFKDAKKVILKWHMLAFNKEVISERTDNELKKLEEDTIKLIKTIETAKKFPTKVSNLCNYCVYKDQCPSFKHELELEKKPLKEFKKDDGLKLVDKFAELQSKKKEAEDNMESLKDDLIEFAKQNNIDIVYGSNKKASVKEYLKVIYPDDMEDFIKLLKKKKLYDEFIMLCYPKLNSKILKNEIDKDLIKLTK